MVRGWHGSTQLRVGVPTRECTQSFTATLVVKTGQPGSWASSNLATSTASACRQPTSTASACVQAASRWCLPAFQTTWQPTRQCIIHSMTFTADDPTQHSLPELITAQLGGGVNTRAAKRRGGREHHGLVLVSALPAGAKPEPWGNGKRRENGLEPSNTGLTS